MAATLPTNRYGQVEYDPTATVSFELTDDSYVMTVNAHGQSTTKSFDRFAWGNDYHMLQEAGKLGASPKVFDAGTAAYRNAHNVR